MKTYIKHIESVIQECAIQHGWTSFHGKQDFVVMFALADTAEEFTQNIKEWYLEMEYAWNSYIEEDVHEFSRKVFSHAPKIRKAQELIDIKAAYAERNYTEFT